MSTVPLQLPVNAGEAGALAGVVLQLVEGRKLNDDVRGRLSARLQALQFGSMLPFAGSLQRDPIHPSTYYVAADTRGREAHALLLRLALSSSPSSGLFPNATLIGRMRTNAGHEVVVNAIRFTHTDTTTIRTFAEKVDRAFLPRPQGSAPAISMEHEQPEVTLPRAFDAYRAIFRATGTNVAAVTLRGEAALNEIGRASCRERV